MILEVKDVHVELDGVPILRGVCLDVDKGETVILLGRNGAGKTTTMRSIMRIVPIKSGKIIFEEKDITRLKTHDVARIGIGYAPEDRKIFTDLTVEENIEIAIKDLNKKKEIFDEIYSIFPELKKLAGRRGGYLSGGEQKMLAIARALALRPKLLLLDEPLEGLAPVVVKRFYESIQKIKEKGISIFMAESNIAHVPKLADRVFVIERGEIIFEGTSDEMSRNEKVLRVLRGY